MTFFHTFSIALGAILSVLCIVFAAILLRRIGRIGSETDYGLMRLTVDFLVPCLIIDRVLNTDAFNDVQNLWFPPLLGFSLTGAGILIGFAFASLPSGMTGLHAAKQRRTFAACVGLLNYGYVAIPLVDLLFPGDNRTMGVLFLQYLGSEISLWTLVACTLLGKFNLASWKQLLTCPIIAIFIAVPLNLLGHSTLIPSGFHEHMVPYFDFLLWAIHQVGQTAIPISLMMVGLTITELIQYKEIRKRFQKTLKISCWSCLMRLLVMPMIFLTLAVTLPCTIEIKRILVIHGAMGSAIFPIVMSKYYDGHTETAFDTIISNTFVSILTMPLWIAIGLNLI